MYSIHTALKSLASTALLLCIGFFPLHSTADPAAGHKSHKHKADNDGHASVFFAERDRQIIRDYYLQPKGQLPPGLAKKQSLPPGLQKQLQRNGHLPPGLEKRRLPYDVEARLAPLPAGYERAIVGNDLVLIDASTRLILDVMKDVLR